MRKLLRNRDLVMITASLLGDAVVDLVSAGEETRRRRYFAPLIVGPSKTSGLNRSINRLLKTGELERVIKGGQPYLRLTDSGKGTFYRDFPLFRFQGRKWDGYWVVVSYDIPEKRRYLREYLSDKLQKLGFGMWQKSVYISPHDFGEDIREWLIFNDLTDYVSVSKSKELAPDEKKLAEQVFNLDLLEEVYSDILSRISQLKGEAIPESIRNEYLQLLLTDPFLPTELLPVGWSELKIRKALLPK